MVKPVILQKVILQKYLVIISTMAKLYVYDLGANDRIETSRPTHMRPRPKNGLETLTSLTTSDPQPPTIRTRLCLHVANRVVDQAASTLRQWLSPVFRHRRLQSVLSAAARLIYGTIRYQRIAPLVRQFWCLRSRERVRARRPYFPLPPWSGSRLLILRLTSRRWHQPLASAVVLVGWACTVRPTQLVTMDVRAFPAAGVVCYFDPVAQWPSSWSIQRSVWLTSSY